MAATVSPASAAPTFSDQSHLHIPTHGFPERMGRGRSRSESRLSLPRSDSVFSLSRMRPPSAASSSCSVASHTRRQVYTVDRGVLLAKAGIRTQDTPPPPTPLRLVNKTRRIVGAISLADLLVIAKGVSPMGLQQARSSRAQSVTSAPHFMANDGTYAREQRYSSLGALQSLGKTPWDLLGLSNEDFHSAKDDKGESLSQFLKQQSAPTSEWARGLKGQVTKGRFAAGSHGCLNLTTGTVRGESKGSSRTRSLDNVHFMDYSPSGKRNDNEDAVSPLSPPSQRRGMVTQEDDEYLPMLSPPTSRSGHRDDDEDADDEEDWLSLLSPSAAKSLRALDEAERPYASHRRRKSRKHRDQDEEESPASGSPQLVRKSQRVKRASESEVSSLISQSAEEDIADGHLDRFTASMPKSPKSPRRRPVLRLNGNMSTSSIPKTDNTTVYGRSNSLPSPSKDRDHVGKILPVAPGSPQLQHRWATRSNLSPLISPNFGRKLAGGVGLFDKSPSPLSPKLGFGPGLRRAGGTPPSPRTPAKQRRVNLKNVDAKWPAPLSPDALRKQMMETEFAETAPIAEEVINPEFETLLNFLISESAKQSTQLNHDSKVTNPSENRKSPSPVICINNSDLSGSTQELNSTDTIDVTEQILKNISSELEKSNQSSIYVVGSRLSPAPKHGSRSPSPYSVTSQSESMPNKPEARPPSPFASQTRLSPTPHTYQNVEFRPTQISDHEKVGETISADVSNTASNNTDWKSELLTKTNTQAQLGTDNREEGKEDWLSLLSPMGARSMRALSEAERPHVSLISGSKEQLNNDMLHEHEGSYNSPRISRSPSPYSTGSLKGKRVRPVRPPYPLALQIKGSKSSHLDLILKESDMETEAAPKKPSRTRNFSQQSNSHSFSQRSVTSETSFESYELNSRGQMNSRSPSLCSSLRGKRERPIRPPLPLVLQGRASMSSNLNLQPMEYDGKVTPAHDLDTSHPEPSSIEREVIMVENEPAIIPCTLSQKLGSRTPSPYSTVPEQSEKSPIQLSGNRSPLMLPSEQTLMCEIPQQSGSRSASPNYRASEFRTETPNEMLPSTSPLTLFPAQSLVSEANHKSVSRSPSPYSKAVEIGNVSPYHLAQDSALIKMDHEQPFVVDTSHNSGSRSVSPYYHEPIMVTTNQLPLDASLFKVSPEPSLLCEASQKSVSHSTSPYSRISELRRETANRLPQEASPTNLSLESSLLHEEAQTPSPHSVSPCTRISELRRKSENRLARDTSPPELSGEQSLLGDSTQKPASHSSSPFSRISELRKESRNRLPQEATQPKLSRKQSFLSVFTKKSGSRSASPHSAVSECGSGTPSSLQPSDNTEHNNQLTNEAQRLSHKSDSLIFDSNNLSTSFTEIKPNTTEVNKRENNFETVNLDNESAISSRAVNETLNTNKPNELLDRSESPNDINEQTKATRPARPSPPPPLSFYRRSPVLLSSIISDSSKTVSNDQSQMQNDAVQEETISQSYRFHDLYATTASRQTDRVTYTKDDIKAILRGEKPLRPPPPVIQVIHKRSSSESSLGETGSNKINKNQDSETEQKSVAPIDVESQSDEVSKNLDNKLENSSTADESPVIETKQNKDAEADSATNTTLPTAECKSGQTGTLAVESTEIQSGEADQPPPPPPPRLNQRRRSCISLSTSAKELERTVNPSKGNSVAPDQTQPQIEIAAEVTLSQSYLYDVYASAGSRKAGRVTYTKDDIKALLSGEKPVRPPRPYLRRRNSSIGSSLESPKNDNEINTTKENLVDVATTTEELPRSETDQHIETTVVVATTEVLPGSKGDQHIDNAAVVTTKEVLPGSDTDPHIDNAEDKIVTLDTTLEKSSNNEINKTKINNTDAAHTKMESLHTEISPQPLKAVDSKIKRSAPKRPVRPPLPQLLLSKSSSSANLFSPKEKPLSNKPPMKDKTAVNVKPHGSRSPSPISFMSVKGIGNTRLPMRPPLPVNILVQQWLDKQCKPTK